MKILISVAEAAKQTGTSKGVLYAMVRQRRIPCHRFGDLIRLDLNELLAATRMEAENTDRPCLVRPDGREKPAKIKGNS